MRLVRIKKIYLDLITSGQKKYEIRAESSRTKNVTTGDQILFMSGRYYKAVADIVSTQRFSTRDALLEAIPACDLGAESSQEVRSILQAVYPQDPPLLAWELEVVEG